MVITPNLFFLFFIILLIISTNTAIASAWLAQEGQYKIISKIDFKKYHEKLPYKDYPYMDFNLISFQTSIEKGLSSKVALGYELSIDRILDSTHILRNSEDNIYYIEKLRSNHVFPTNFKSHKFFWKTNILGSGLNILSHQISLTHFKQNKVSISNRIMYGKSWRGKDLSNFFEYQIGYQKFINSSCDDLLELDLTLGLNFKEKRTFLVQIFNDFKINFKEHDRANANESILQFSIVNMVKDGLYLQQGLYTNITNKKNLQSKGIIFGVWVEL